MQLLRRKKIRRDILMQYLARKSIPVVAGTDKVNIQRLKYQPIDRLRSCLGSIDQTDYRILE